MSDDGPDRERQRRAVGRLLIEVGGLLTDDEKRARVEAKIRELREQIGNDPRKAMELARAIAEAMQRGRD